MYRDSNRQHQATAGPASVRERAAQAGRLDAFGHTRADGRSEGGAAARPISSPLVTAIALALRAVERSRELERAEVAA
jgi:hypothetical protein